MATADEQLKEQLSGAAALAAQIDKEKIGEKVRVYSLAKTLGIASKLLIEQLASLGISKKPQSTLTVEEVGKLFDSLQSGLKQPPKEASKKTPKTTKESTKASKASKTTKTSKTTKRSANAVAKKSDEMSVVEVSAEAQTDTAQPSSKESAAATTAGSPEPTEPTKKTRKRAVKKSAGSKAKMSANKAEPEASSVDATQGEDADVSGSTGSVEAVETPAAVEQTKKVPAGDETLQTETSKRSRTRRVVKRSSSAPTVIASKTVAEEPASSQESEERSDETPEDDGDKLRYRVQKNVENEIQQIEGKVESDLAVAALGALAEKKNESAAGQDAGESHETDINIDGSFVESLLARPEQPQNDDDVLAAYAPVFMPPKSASDGTAASKNTANTEDSENTESTATTGSADAFGSGFDNESEDSHESSSSRRRRGHRGTSRGRGKETTASEQPVKQDVEIIDEPRGIKGSTRIESQRRRRAEMRSKDKESRHVVSQAEFLARREAVERTMVVRERERHDGHGMITQVGVLEDGMLVEHFVTDESNTSTIGNIYLGRVQNVLPSMEAAFIDIGTGRNGVLYAGEVNWRQAGLGGRSRKIEQAMRSGDQVLVQVAKDPIGHKGPRLTTQISLPGRFLVYVPGGRNAGISRKLPAPERKRLREILEKVVPDQGGAIIRTAAENVAEDAIAADVNRLHDRWNDIQEAAKKEKSSKGSDPVALYEEPQMLVKVVRDLFNEDFDRLVVDGRRPYEVVSDYVNRLAPELAGRVSEYDRAAQGGVDAFEAHRIDEQLQKALSRKVWLPSGGTLVIDRTEAMTVVDVNTGKFTGTGGNLEETVTKNNLEAAEEIVRQMRLRDLGGMIVVDFIDMVLPENQELVLRRLKESLGRDRTRHQVSEVTSLGLVQMTRKRLGSGLLEAFSTECETCQGRGLILHEDPVEEDPFEGHNHDHRGGSRHDNTSEQRRRRKHSRDSDQHDQAVKPEHKDDTAEPVEDHVEEDKHHGSQERGSLRGQSRRTSSRRRAQRGPASRGVESRGGESRRDKARQDASNQDESSLEDLIAGIVVDSSNTQDDKQQKVRGQSRRHAESDSQSAGSVSDIESIVYAASDRAEALDEVGEFATYVSEEDSKPEPKSSQDASGSKSYEQARKEFEDSPRRKRKTRGNSISDRAPQPEDFATAGVQADSQDTGGQTAKHTEAVEKPDSGMAIKRDSKRRRVRATNRRTQPANARDTNAGAASDETKSVESAESDIEKPSQRGSKRAQVQAVTRGRRRAVRRVTQPSSGAQGAAAEKKGAAEPRNAESAAVEAQRKRTDNGVEVTTVRRGRKRAVRRLAPRVEKQQREKNQPAPSAKQMEKTAPEQKPQGRETKSADGRTRRRVARRGSK